MNNSIYVYRPDLVVNSYCADQISARLSEFAGPSNIVPLTDSSYLCRELTSHELGTLVIPGGSTFGISNGFTVSRNPMLNILFQCLSI